MPTIFKNLSIVFLVLRVESDVSCCPRPTGRCSLFLPNAGADSYCPRFALRVPQVPTLILDSGLAPDPARDPGTRPCRQLPHGRTTSGQTPGRTAPFPTAAPHISACFQEILQRTQRTVHRRGRTGEGQPEEPVPVHHVEVGPGGGGHSGLGKQPGAECRRIVGQVRDVGVHVERAVRRCQPCLLYTSPSP